MIHPNTSKTIRKLIAYQNTKKLAKARNFNERRSNTDWRRDFRAAASDPGSEDPVPPTSTEVVAPADAPKLAAPCALTRPSLLAPTLEVATVIVTGTPDVTVFTTVSSCTSPFAFVFTCTVTVPDPPSMCVSLEALASADPVSTRPPVPTELPPVSAVALVWLVMLPEFDTVIVSARTPTGASAITETIMRIEGSMVGYNTLL